MSRRATSGNSWPEFSSEFDSPDAAELPDAPRVTASGDPACPFCGKVGKHACGRIEQELE